MKYLLILLMIWNSANAHTKDTCQKYRDSVTKYDANIKVWQKQISPNNSPGYNILIQEKINAMAIKRNEFVEKLKKCKP